MNIIKYISRLSRLDKLIRNKATGSPKELADKLELSESSVYLLIKTMKSLGAPITFNHYRNSYIYYEECEFVFGFKEINKEEITNLNGGFIKYVSIYNLL